MSALRAHVVREGEYLSQIAARLGCTPESIWEHPKNAELRATRQHMDVLVVGDVLWLPEVRPRQGLALQTGKKNRYQAAVPLVRVTLVLRLGSEPLKNETYIVRGANRKIEGTTDGDGRVVIEVPTTMREGEILLPAKGYSFPLRIGDMDPITERSGVLKRLANLGLFHPPVDTTTADEAFARSLSTFQRLEGLEVTGEADDETRRRLVERFGC